MKYLEFIKKNWLTIGLLAIILYLLLDKLHLNHKLTKTENKLLTLPKYDTVKIKKDATGQKYEQIKETVYTKEQFDYLADSLKKKYKVSSVKSADNLIIMVHDTVNTTTPIYIDSFTHKIYAERIDKDLSITFTGDSKSKTGYFTVDLTPDTVNLTRVVKRRTFAPDDVFLNVAHTNALVTTSAGYGYTYKEPRSVFVFGPQIGVRPTLGSPAFAPYIGLGVTYNIWSIKTK